MTIPATAIMAVAAAHAQLAYRALLAGHEPARCRHAGASFFTALAAFYVLVVGWLLP
ncbi:MULTISPECIES: hypothetical protein [Methylobacterium]|uniref:Uncharacterized protein n=1 Tax=Methylobacterium jeotgali TaxID=381630 RepID=A0ABQ4SZD6_9HYPH|nr:MULTISPECIES: hypothetical protein [Methylobacterium]GBU17243.1 hypothetical protein AwMethylo_14580 [Methylobacterium sp.]GJE07843.1 hypothetical protein AOPFMNJM_3175 [Methylobacterium jeotgali]